MQAQANPQIDTFRRRLPVVILGLIAFSLYLLWTLASFQWLSPEVLSYMDNLRDSNYNRTLRLAAARGLIYDRDGEVLSVNTLDYGIGISPNLVTDARLASTQLSALLGLDELETFQKITSNQPWVLLASPVNAETAQRVSQLNIEGLTRYPIPRRSYPQGTLASQVLGFVNLDLEGHYGIEGYYQDQLAGQVRDRQISSIPFDVPQSAIEADHGRDLILTIDRDVQFLAELELQTAITDTGAEGGTIIIMDPRNGDVLAMASYPAFDPNAYFEVNNPQALVNPAISGQYEPGSIMKILTIASALDNGTITPQFTYYDNGSLVAGGVTIQNWDRAAHGTIDATQILVQSLNVGAATVSTSMGPTSFYKYLDAFGIGKPTGIDLEGEAGGTLYVPGDENWSDSQLATNSFGQGVAATPLQMLTAVNAIANGGLMMQPHLVHAIRDGSQTFVSQPSALNRPISAQTANEVTQMLVATVRDGVDQASVDGYTIAGKSGTAEIPSPIGYESGAWIMSFVGYFPADDPQVSILIKLDRPTSGNWASQVAAPIFRDLAERLVILLEIPPDDIRHQLVAQGGAVNAIRH
jgi:cell division protein FtsI (penicillin-binding protein 3)